MINTLTAIKTGDLDVIHEKILTRKIQNGYVHNEASALHLSVLYGQANIVKMLIKAGASVNLRTGTQALNHFAIPENSTAIHIAASSGNIEITKILINSKALLTDKDGNSNTPLMLAIKNDFKALINLLLSHNTFPPVDKKEVCNIFVEVISKDNDFMARRMLHDGLIKVTQEFEDGKSLLLRAIENNATKVCCLLVDYGANINSGHCKSNTNQSESLKYLNDPGYNPLLQAILRNNITIANKLIENDANINFDHEVPTNDYYPKKKTISLISIAISNSYNEIAVALIKAGANFMYSWKNHDLPVKIAIDMENYDVIKAMMETSGLDYFKREVESNPDNPKYQNIGIITQEIEEIIQTHNKLILKDFLAYLFNDKYFNCSAISDEILNLVVEYSNNCEQLDPIRFKNYMHYNPVNSDSMVDLFYQTSDLRPAGMVSTDDGL